MTLLGVETDTASVAEGHVRGRLQPRPNPGPTRRARRDAAAEIAAAIWPGRPTSDLLQGDLEPLTRTQASRSPRSLPRRRRRRVRLLAGWDLS
jgi:hypothetical protein